MSTPWYSWNTAKVGIEHQSINHISLDIEICIKSITIYWELRGFSTKVHLVNEKLNNIFIMALANEIVLFHSFHALPPVCFIICFWSPACGAHLLQHLHQFNYRHDNSATGSKSCCWSWRHPGDSPCDLDTY